MPWVKLDKATYRRLEYFAKRSFIEIDRAAIEAINEWMDMTGDLIIADIDEDSGSHQND